MTGKLRSGARVWAAVLAWGLTLTWTASGAALERFNPPDSAAVEVWRLTNDPTVRDWANYHNTQCWSPDGRYLCFTHYASNGVEFGTNEAAEIHVYDLHAQTDLKLDNGTDPRWGNRHNWLFYLHWPAEEGEARLMWRDVDTGAVKRIAYGVRNLKEPDCEDRWIFGFERTEDRALQGVRVAICEDSRPERLQWPYGWGYNSLYVNPRHPMITSRDHNLRDRLFAPEEDPTLIPFFARHYSDHDLDGRNGTVPFSIMDGAHFSWSGDGKYFLCGNEQVRGRLWNEPLPSNIHFLATIQVGDISKCGHSGRWICGISRSTVRT